MWASSSITSSLISRLRPGSFFFFFNDTATTEIYTLSLHDALPISRDSAAPAHQRPRRRHERRAPRRRVSLLLVLRSEEHTSELQSQSNLVCRLLLEKKKKKVSSRVYNGHSRTILYT